MSFPGGSLRNKMCFQRSSQGLEVGEPLRACVSNAISPTEKSRAEAYYCYQHTN